jgi:hypothetical protein
LPLDCERARHLQRRNDIATVTALNTPSQRSGGTPEREFSVHDNGAMKKSA